MPPLVQLTAEVVLFDSDGWRQAVIRVMGWRLPGARRVKKAEMPGQCRAEKYSARFGGLFSI